MRSGLTASEVSSMLLSLELQDLIKTTHGGYQLT
jgi:predicted Rossmann fold nucleotide-binding protein DprA/Smf involved in DNA uptake